MPTIAELLEALPADDPQAPDDAGPQSRMGVLDHVTHRTLPIGSLSRLCSLGGLQAKIGMAYFAWWIRRCFRGADARQQSLLDTHLRSALRTLEAMGYLRGAVMKIGQMAANLPHVVPAAFAETLSRLHFEAPPMHYSLLREYLEDELGGDPQDIFAEFEQTAFAAASLGQVHRARLRTGQLVAVKIQYPGIARTIRSDFRNVFAILSPLRFTGEWENLKSQLEELRRIIELETDYELEARTLQRVRELFTEEDGIVVPRVHDKFSTRRVLTMDYIDGQTIDTFLAGQPTQECRNAFSAKILRASCRVLYGLRMQYADPHLGNYLFLDDGRLGFIDFGCMRPWNDAEWEYMRLADQALCDQSYEALAAHIRRGVEFTEDQLKDAALMDLMVEYCRWIWEPMTEDSDYFCGDPAYIRRGVDIVRRFTKVHPPRQKPVNVFIQRAFWASWGVHFRLQSCFNAKRIIEEEIAVTGWRNA